MLSSVNCAAHPDAAASVKCHVCDEPLCAACVAYDVDGDPACDACGRAEDARSRSLGTAMLALGAVGYLGALALGVALFKPRPFIGGVAALVAIAAGRALTFVFKLPTVVPRLKRS